MREVYQGREQTPAPVRQIYSVSQRTRSNNHDDDDRAHGRMGNEAQCERPRKATTGCSETGGVRNEDDLPTPRQLHLPTLSVATGMGHP